MMQMPTWIASRRRLPAGAKVAWSILSARRIDSVAALAAVMRIPRMSAYRHVLALRAAGLLPADSMRPAAARPYRPVVVAGVELPAGACRQIAAQLRVTPSLVYRVAKGAKRSAKIRRMLEMMAERVRRAG